MTINNNYNFGLLTDDGTASKPTSLQNLKSFQLIYETNTNTWTIGENILSDYSITYSNTTQNIGHASYDGLMVFNKKGKNFVILLQNSLQQFLTSSNYAIFSGPGTIPSINNLGGLQPTTYPELPTFINGYNGYNISSTLFSNASSDLKYISPITFYILD